MLFRNRKQIPAPPAPSTSTPWKPPHPRYLFGLGLTVPMMVMSIRGTSPACRASSKGTFWEKNGDLVLAENQVQSQMLRYGLALGVTTHQGSPVIVTTHPTPPVAEENQAAKTQKPL